MTRPDNVPSDWVHVGCDNPECPNMVWVPRLQTGTPVVNVCSAACAMTMATAWPFRAADR